MTGTITKAKYPKADTGISFEKPFDKNAKAVVDEVARMASEALLKVYAILLCREPVNYGYMSDCSQASHTTKMLSQDIPRITNTISKCNELRFEIPIANL